MSSDHQKKSINENGADSASDQSSPRSSPPTADESTAMSGSTNTGGGGDLPLRLATVTLAAPLVVLCLSRSEYSARILLHAVHFVCALEWIRLVPQAAAAATPTTTTTSPFEDACLKLFPAASLCIASCQSPLPVLPILYCAFALLPHFAGATTTASSSQHCISGLLYLSLGFHHLLKLSSASFAHSLLFIFTIWNADTGALLAGRLTKLVLPGRDPMAAFLPGNLVDGIGAISPRKTVTGIAGGLVCAALTAVFLPDLLIRLADALPSNGAPMRDLGKVAARNLLDYDQFGQLASKYVPAFGHNVTLRRAAVGLLLAVCGCLGDLAESAVKRSSASGAKDSGGAGVVVPGHGGLLDRMDSTLIASGVYYYCFLA